MLKTGYILIPAQWYRKIYFRVFTDKAAHNPTMSSAIPAVARGSADFVVGIGVGCVVAGSAFKVA